MKLIHLFFVVLLLLVSYILCYGQYFTSQQIDNLEYDFGLKSQRVTITSGTVIVTPSGKWIVVVSSGDIYASQKGNWYVTITTFPVNYPLPDNQIGQLRNVWITTGTVTISNATFTVTADNLDVRDLSSGQDSVLAVQSGDWYIKKATVVVENQISGYATESTLGTLFKQGQLIGNTTFNVNNFPADYPDATAQTSLSSINGKIIKCDTDGVKITSGTVTFTNTNVDTTGSTVTITNSQFAVTQSGSWNIQKSTAYIENVVTVKDDRYAGKVSSWTAGKVTGVTSQTIDITDFGVNCFSFFAEGSTGIVDSNFGAGLFLLDGVGQEPVKLDQAKSNASFYMRDLSAGATYLYFVSGIK